MLKLEGNQPKEHNNSNNKAIFPFLLNFLIYGYITGTQVMLNAVMLKVVVVFLDIYLLIIIIIIIFNPESWRLFSSSYTKKKQPKPKKLWKKDKYVPKTNTITELKKIHMKHRCSHLLLILWLSVCCLGLHLVWSFRWVDTMGLFTNIKLSTCLRLWRLKTMVGQLLGTRTRGTFQEAKTEKFCRSWLPSCFISW